MTDDYNYNKFDRHQYDLTEFSGPSIGDPAPDFSALLLDGGNVRLSDYRNSLTVLEMGSITCPIYQTRLNGMNQLTHEFPDVQFLVLYVREAHPGERIGKHRNLEEKKARATELEQEFGETRALLIDDLEGTAHGLYGAMPNSVFVIDSNGIVAFRSDWNDVSATATALNRLQRGKSARKVHAYFKPATPWIAREVFRHAGPGAAGDFLRSMPALVGQNMILRNLKEFLGH